MSIANIGKRIKEEREKMHLSQEDVAKALNTTKQSICKYENDIVTNIPLDKVEKMALLFGVTPQYLTGWEEKEKPTDEGQLEDDVIILHWNGQIIKKELTKEQAGMLMNMISAIPDKPKQYKSVHIVYKKDRAK